MPSPQTAIIGVSGLRGLDVGVLTNIRENYTMRLWRFPDQARGEGLMPKFQTTTKRARQRKLESVLDGWARGYELRVTGATTAHLVARQQIARTIEDRNLVQQGLTAGIFATHRKDGDWAEVEHPNFSK